MFKKIISLLTFSSLIVIGSSASAQTYEISVTNLTKGQFFTPILGVTHTPNISLFEVGEAASPELELVAEEGDLSGFTTVAPTLSDVRGTGLTSGLLDPGATATFTVSGRRARRFSLVAMMLPTNDGFVGLNTELPLGRRNRTKTVYAFGYDAGTELNDELCSSIPGPAYPECVQSITPQSTELAIPEGFVSIHNGVKGIGNFSSY